jgi:hypothetical protein
MGFVALDIDLQEIDSVDSVNGSMPIKCGDRNRNTTLVIPSDYKAPAGLLAPHERELTVGCANCFFLELGRNAQVELKIPPPSLGVRRIRFECVNREVGSAYRDRKGNQADVCANVEEDASAPRFFRNETTDVGLVAPDHVGLSLRTIREIEFKSRASVESLAAPNRRACGARKRHPR